MKANFSEFLYNEADHYVDYDNMVDIVEASIDSKHFSEAIEEIDRLYRKMFGSDFFDEKSDEEFQEFLDQMRIESSPYVAIRFMNAWLTYEEENVDVPDVDDPVLGLRASLGRAY